MCPTPGLLGCAQACAGASTTAIWELISKSCVTAKISTVNDMLRQLHQNRAIDKLKRTRKTLAINAKKLVSQQAQVRKLTMKGIDATQAMRKLADIEEAYRQAAAQNEALTRSFHEALLSTRG